MVSPADFIRILTESKLTRSELASLYGVTRQTIHYWATVSLPTGSITGRMAEVITRALVNAIERKILPLGGMAREARKVKISGMSKTLQNLKPAPVQ